MSTTAYALSYTREDGTAVSVRVEAGTILAIFEGETCVRYKIVRDVEAGMAEARGYAMGDLEALAKLEAEVPHG